MKFVTHEQFEKKLMKNPEVREYHYWGDHSGSLLEEIRISSGITQEKLAKKMKTKQSNIARAENHSCSLTFLNRAAKATGHYLEIKVKKVV